MRKSKSPDLDRDRLVAASFDVLEEYGLEGLSMRKVAARLGVQAPAVYWHVEDKAELLGLMARQVYAEAYAAVVQARDWQDWLMRFGVALRASFTGHRDGAYLCASAKPIMAANPRESADRISAPLMAFGLDQQSALSGQTAVISYTLGLAMCESNGPMHDYLDRMMSFEDNFRIGLEAIVTGIEAYMTSSVSTKVEVVAP